MRTRVARLVVVAVLGAALPMAAAMRAEADPPTYKTGYIPVAVGTPEETTLHYKVMLPNPDVWGPGPYPAVIDYSGYLPAQNVYDGLDDRFIAAGYAVVGLNMRGSGCSGGLFNYFEPRQAKDGKEAIEWLAQQKDWSNGRFAMVGKSYPGISQLFVAAENPEPLKAIVPGHVFADLYRDVPWPGGILNATFAAGWSAQRVNEGYLNPPQWYSETGDQKCIENAVDHAPNLAFNPLVQGSQPQNHFDSEFYRVRSPFWWAERIKAPTMLVQSWQDEQVGGRAVHMLERLQVPWKFIGTNGDHGEYYGDDVFPHILRFLQYHLKQQIPAGEQRTITETATVPVKLPNGNDHPIKKTTTTVTRPETFAEALARFNAEDRVRINWENGAGGGRRSASTKTYPSWPIVPHTGGWRLHLGADGSLDESGAEPGTVPYNYVPEHGSQQRGGHPLEVEGIGPGEATWADRPPEGTSAAFTTAPLTSDKVMAGSASLDLLVSSTAADTDFEVTLSEVRPDGTEMFVQQGWLRASHRKEAGPLFNGLANLSTPLRPFQTHELLDIQPLVPSMPTPMRLEIFPFAHTFRTGSQLRIAIAAPHLHPDLWGFVALPVPAVNTVHTGPGASSLVLPVIPGAVAETPLPPCTLRNQPCRAEPAS